MVNTVLFGDIHLFGFFSFAIVFATSQPLYFKAGLRLPAETVFPYRAFSHGTFLACLRHLFLSSHWPLTELTDRLKAGLTWAPC